MTSKRKTAKPKTMPIYQAAGRLALIREVYETLFNATSTFDCEHLGVQLSYLFGVMSNPVADGIEWFEGGENDYCISLFRDTFPADHQVWQFIEIVQE